MVRQMPQLPEVSMEEEIPFQVVKWNVYTKLAMKLDPDTVSSGNWRMLADKLGYTTEDICNFDSRQAPHGSNTLKVLEDYNKKRGSTVNEVLQSLKDIDRLDAVSELQSALPEIEQIYHDQQKRSLVETDYQCMSCDPVSYAMSPYAASYRSCHAHKHGHMDSFIRPPVCSLPMEAGNKHYHRHFSVEQTPGCIREPRMNGRLPGYEHTSPEFKRQRSMPPLSDSLMVRGRDSRSQYFPEPMDHSSLRDDPALAMMRNKPMDHSLLRDDPVPPAMAMMRNRLPQYDSQFSMPMGLPVAPMSRMPNMPNKDATGIFNSSFPKSTQSRHEHLNLKLEMPSADMYSHPRAGEFYSPSPTPTTPSTPLARLKQLTSEQFQPDDGYTDLIRIKREDDMLHNKPAHMAQYDVEKMDADMVYCPSRKERNRHSDEIVGAHANLTNPPSTFPLRAKANSCSSTSSNMSPPAGQIHKSVSLPNDMKPAEFKKAFRHIKVLVTYAADDKKHTQRVLNLCKCLEKNGFTCCVDIYHRELEEGEKATWCQDRFEEVDFILVIVSNKYRREVDSCELDQDADDSDSLHSDTEVGRDDRPNHLHTKHIYKLMCEENSSQGSQRNSRFVPVLFQGVDSGLIPHWMYCAYNKISYAWPKQYKDLLWMLTKPENRIPEHVPPFMNQSQTNSTSENPNMSDSSEVNADSE